MSRSGYVDDYGYDDPLVMGRWRGRVASAIRGKRGQAFLRDLLAALDELPEKRLIADELMDEDGAVCALGSVCVRRGIDTGSIDAYDSETVGSELNIASPMAKEIAYVNDDYICPGAVDEEEKRFKYVRAWVVSKIRPEAQPPPPGRREEGREA